MSKKEQIIISEIINHLKDSSSDLKLHVNHEIDILLKQDKYQKNEKLKNKTIK